MKRGLHDVARPAVSEWEPEPLHVPVSDRWEEGRSRRIQSDDDVDERSGSHVIVIDLG